MGLAGMIRSKQEHALLVFPVERGFALLSWTEVRDSRLRLEFSIGHIIDTEYLLLVAHRLVWLPLSVVNAEVARVLVP